MRLKNNFLSLALLLSVMILLAGCRENRAVQLLWPDLDDPYAEVVEKWTRTGSIYSGFETEVIAHATLKSRQWREAYTEKKARIYLLSEKEKKALGTEMAGSLDRETEVFLSMFSPRPEQARIRFDGSLWSIFILDQGEKIYPLEIRPVRKSLPEIQAFYPHAGQWRENYILRFPAKTMDSLVMVITGPLGRIEFKW